MWRSLSREQRSREHEHRTNVEMGRLVVICCAVVLVAMAYGAVGGVFHTTQVSVIGFQYSDEPTSQSISQSITTGASETRVARDLQNIVYHGRPATNPNTCVV
ncbi:hypothetical protein E2C01_053898 [Portunus trituberculatus]|uniref:Uncharacterized protein n=1 Tax=Portunus trituberculatus TaxID=210409 RepID=A0A5B7GHW6_PORTR|nr:hypothetical protein [Portunus trituberculatus]